MVSDVGQHQMFTCRYAKFNSSKSNVTLWRLGTMGFALPAAIGAKMGMPDRKWLQLLVMVDSNDDSRIRNYFQTKYQLKLS
jgi:acetolactate synthase-1/2/3 large subunit